MTVLSVLVSILCLFWLALVAFGVYCLATTPPAHEAPARHLQAVPDLPRKD